MARIKIEDLPKDMKINKQDLKTILGGLSRDPMSAWTYEIGGATHKDSWKGE